MPTPLIRKLEAFGPLPERDKRALELATRCTRRVDAGRDLVREGDRPTECQLILEGVAYRHRTLEGGQRQIMSFEIPSDLCDLHGFLMGQTDHGIITLTPCTVATLPREVLLGWYEERPAVAQALWRGLLVDAAISRTWLLNIGRRTARGRIAHMLCEVLRRLQAVGLAEEGGGTLPIPPAEIADVLGLSVVHVHRALQELHREGLVTPGGGQVTIDHPPRLEAAGGFDPAYLHLKGDGDGQVRGQRSGRRAVGEADGRCARPRGSASGCWPCSATRRRWSATGTAGSKRGRRAWSGCSALHRPRRRARSPGICCTPSFRNPGPTWWRRCGARDSGRARCGTGTRTARPGSRRKPGPSSPALMVGRPRSWWPWRTRPR